MSNQTIFFKKYHDYPATSNREILAEQPHLDLSQNDAETIKINCHRFENEVFCVRHPNEMLIDNNTIWRTYLTAKLNYDLKGMPQSDILAKRDAKKIFLAQVGMDTVSPEKYDAYWDFLFTTRYVRRNNNGTFLMGIIIAERDGSMYGDYKSGLSYLTDTERQSLIDAHINFPQVRREFGLYHEHMHNFGTDDERKCDSFAFLKILQKYQNPALLKALIYPRIFVPFDCFWTIQTSTNYEESKSDLSYIAPKTHAYFLKNAPQLIQKINGLSEYGLIQEAIKIANRETKQYIPYLDSLLILLRSNPIETVLKTNHPMIEAMRTEFKTCFGTDLHEPTEKTPPIQPETEKQLTQKCEKQYAYFLKKEKDPQNAAHKMLDWCLTQMDAIGHKYNDICNCFDERTLLNDKHLYTFLKKTAENICDIKGFVRQSTRNKSRLTPRNNGR